KFFLLLDIFVSARSIFRKTTNNSGDLFLSLKKRIIEIVLTSPSYLIGLVENARGTPKKVYIGGGRGAFEQYLKPT
ncbi:hypothetical protein, partial [Klebsiella aerogenes]|uniref:hypothetical protein n=1 Tax=Klebsiella aerogenes TaxID=548 RepID=UPI001CC7FA8D